MSVEDSIRGFIRKELLIDAGTPLADDTPLIEETLIDSMGIFTLAAYLEKQFGIEIHDKEMIPEHFGSIASLARLVELKRAVRGSGPTGG